IPSLWEKLYEGIEYANILLKYLPEVPDLSAETRGSIAGRALFLRGFLYFQLVTQWGAVPLKLDPTAGPEDIHYARAPIEEVYAQILADLIEAESLLPTTASSQYG